ncbi:erythronate-4-phosphate dehydrogenase [Candidatus Blochmanniella floridana]|uniref:Erythronate-4-phosphate dehydrogenase n=1 Tax=Blochmanniella floridana TaxID=203907 RepID=PDXB_BLOFL|nr:RecName: Full=Erythronate-4-phosphate dehydrogenase [Candidatus Blochmannia floridanus]CAD83186.1 erythronate-4-phosphate dehydrogenase [Candidatus Blochmannia floridanus]
MRILADQAIPYVYKLFGSDNYVQVCDGRSISANMLKDVDVLIIRSITKVNHMLLYDSSIKFIGTVTSGVDHIDQNYLKNNNIRCVSTPGSNAVSVVEYVCATLFWLAQRDCFFLRDKTVGIIGVGNIGNLLYQRLNSLGVHTLLYDPYKSKCDTDRMSWKSLDILVSKSDILTLHVPLTYTGAYPTWHMINKDILDALPSNSILINTSRGAVVNNDDLLAILRCGKKINVILDVWESEPKLSLPLLSYVDIGTAHIAGYSFESRIRSIKKIYDDYCDYFNVKNKVNWISLGLSDIRYIAVSRLDECIINRLIQLVYNVYYDHIALKNNVLRLRGFDKLREYYCFRREWSSLLVDSKNGYNNDILFKFGFSTL